MKSEKIYNLKQRTYQYGLDILKFLELLPRDYVAETIGKQLLRSATSIGANVAEAQASSSKRDFANFYSYALKSANESLFWLGLLRDSGKVAHERVTPLMDEVTELSKILAACLLTIKGKRRF